MKLLITSLIVLNACARGRKALSQTVDKYTQFFGKFLSEIRKILNIIRVYVCVSTMCHIAASRQSIISLAAWLVGLVRGLCHAS